MLTIFSSDLNDIAGHPIFIHSLHPIHLSVFTLHLEVNGLLNSSISCFENFLRAHGHLAIITDGSSSSNAQSKLSFTCDKLFGFIVLMCLTPHALTNSSIFTSLVTSPCNVYPVPGFC